MMQQLQLRIAGIGFNISLRGIAHTICAAADEKYASFQRGASEGFNVEADAATGGKDFQGPPRITNTGAHESAIAMPGLEARVDWRSKTVHARVLFKTLHPIDNLLRALVSEALLRRGTGVLLHASGVLTRDGALVFAGESGAGKTTLARKAELANVLSDELVALVVEGGGAKAFATPFYGEMSKGVCGADARLAALCLLSGKDKRVCSILPRAEAVQRSLSTVLCFSPRGDDAAKVLNAIAASTPVVGLTTLHDEPLDEIIARINAVLS